MPQRVLLPRWQPNTETILVLGLSNHFVELVSRRQQLVRLEAVLVREVLVVELREGSGVVELRHRHQRLTEHCTAERATEKGSAMSKVQRARMAGRRADAGIQGGAGARQAGGRQAPSLLAPAALTLCRHSCMEVQVRKL